MWKADVDSLESMTVASLRFVDGHVSAIDFTETDETGDWIVYDRYTFEPSGRLLRLERRTNLATVDRGILETFVLKGDKVTRTNISQRSLRTDAPLPSKNVWTPNLPVRKAVGDFPFGQLVQRDLENLRTKGKVCSGIR